MHIRFSFFSKEVLVPGTPIHIFLPRIVDPASIQKAIRVQLGSKRQDVPIRVDDAVAELSTHGLASDLYKICVDRIVDDVGHSVNAHPTFRFVCIRKFPATIPKHLRVQHVVHVAVGELTTQRLRPGEKAPSGMQYISRVKAVHRDTHVPCCLAFDERGQEVDGDKIISAVSERQFAKFGRIHKKLWHDLEKADESETFAVVVWPLLEFDPSTLRKDHYDINVPPSGIGSHAKDTFRAPKANLIALVKSLGAVVEDYSELPLFLTHLKVAQIRQVAKSEDLGMIFEYSHERVQDGNFKTMAVSRGDKALDMGHKGENIRVVVLWDKGPKDTTNLDFAGRFVTDPTKLDQDSFHSRMVCGIIKNTEPLTVPDAVNGYAPACQLYSANQLGLDALQWAVLTNLCTVSVLSTHDHPEGLTPDMSLYDVQLDYLAVTFPFTTFINAAGEPRTNTTLDDLPESTEFVVHKGYNTMAVGAHRNHLSGPEPVPHWEDFRNPSSPHHDRELPEIVAPGDKVYFFDKLASGTSFAAPAVGGTVAVMQSTHPGLIHRPEACRAILLAGAGRNAMGNNWWTDVQTLVLADASKHVDAKDGAGILDALASVKIAQQFNIRPPLAEQAQSLGWAAGKFGTDDFGANRLSENRWLIKVPVPPTTDPTILQMLNLRATLAWNSTITFKAGMAPSLQSVEMSTLTVNLDLILLDKNSIQVANSSSLDNSYEVIDFHPVPGEIYQLAVSLSSGLTASTNFTFYGVAWCCFLKGVSM